MCHVVTKGPEVSIVCECDADDTFGWWMDDEPEMAWKCSDCLFMLDDDVDSNDSARFRAEVHARDTGHRVALYLEVWDHFPDQPLEVCHS